MTRTIHFVLPALDPLTGLLPTGRHVCTEAEVESVFVRANAFSASVTRQVIWSNWVDGLALLKSAVAVRAAWVGGSFTTSKVDPDDIDVTFIVDGTDMRSREPAEQQIISLFMSGGLVKNLLKLRVDSYILPWECVPAPRPGMGPVQDQYYWARGYWDDWWQRSRVTAKGGMPTSADALPRRGYLEVPVSDYA